MRSTKPREVIFVVEKDGKKFRFFYRLYIREKAEEFALKYASPKPERGIEIEVSVSKIPYRKYRRSTDSHEVHIVTVTDGTSFICKYPAERNRGVKNCKGFQPPNSALPA